MINESMQRIHECITRRSYLCDKCKRSKPRSKDECWCRNKVIEKKYDFEHCDFYEAKSVEDDQMRAKG